MSDQPQRRFHGEVKVQRNGLEVRVNIFDDNREVVYLEMQHAIAQFAALSGDPKSIQPMNNAQREIARAEQARAEQAKVSAAVNAPPCQECGSDEAMELIRWKDKNTGEPRQAWKCQNCNLWCKEW